MARDVIHVEGATQNNLRNVSLDIPLGELTVVTGVSGSGKSSLAFDTIYAEGQRRYVETFSPYARQFLDRMDKPKAERIDGIPPAIAIDQTNPVRTSRSTVGTMTELNDHLKLLFARAAQLYCNGCGKPVQRDSPEAVLEQLLKTEGFADASVLIAFPVDIAEDTSEDAVREVLSKAGYERFMQAEGGGYEVIQDRVVLSSRRRKRIVESVEIAMQHGRGRVAVHRVDRKARILGSCRFSSDLHCADCDRHFRDPVPNMFSFNSPMGACETCRGFGRSIGIDYGLVMPNPTLSLAEGVIKPWTTASYSECQDDLMRFARKRDVPTTVPWCELPAKTRRWVIDGEGDWEDGVWYGVQRFFDWLEGRSYRMHIRVLLSKYRAYHACPDCGGARLKPEGLQWYIRSGDHRFNIRDVMLLPLSECRDIFDRLVLSGGMDAAMDMLLTEIRTRLGFLVDVGLGYLTLDRQSRTLSGGEVQRINLTTALGTSLVNTLFVLDEPSIGLHPRDIDRLVGVLHRLRDAGNTLLVVEHDPDVIRAADRVLDMGPGPGERGGEVVFHGTRNAFMRSKKSLTAQYLSGKRAVSVPTPEIVEPISHGLRVLGAAEHNLQKIDVKLPLNRLVCISGVSGSGKSTLMNDILYRALCKLKHKPDETPGLHASIEGDALIDDVVLVDQSPVGKSARSNPCSYTGAFEAIRKRFAVEPLAKERGYRPGSFSFNSGLRCPTCSGNGFERVEMQFLSDVYLRCPDCNGRRYQDELLDVKVACGRRALSIADVLELTVEEACECFADQLKIVAALEPLRAVGLGYVQLGQPVPTLSSGEAQRLKLAAHLRSARACKPGGTLFLLDEPTTGLHFDDIRVLLDALRRLIDAGHSIMVIEHNLDVLRAADWIVDLGPEGGDAGGRIVCAGTPDVVRGSKESHTGRALRELEAAGAGEAGKGKVRRGQARDDGRIVIHNAREHNLRGVDVSLPREKLSVITGVSGSGKSTVAFDILFAEGQRRYLESLNAYARQFVQPAGRPEADAILGIPPTVAIEQRTSRGGRKSTVATVTEIYHFLRLLFVKLGTPHCPDCNEPIQTQTEESIVAAVRRQFAHRRVTFLAPLVRARKGYYTDLARWALGRGFQKLRVDGEWLPTDNWPRLDRFKEHDIELPVGNCLVDAKHDEDLAERVSLGLELGESTVAVLPLSGAGARSDPVLFSTRRACLSCGQSFPELDPRLFSYNSKHGWCPRCYGTGLLLDGFDEEQTGEEIWWTDWWEGPELNCPDCEGRRLRPEALAVQFRKRNIADFAALSVEQASHLFDTMRMDDRELAVGRDVLAELQSRLRFLQQVGLGYLTLDRAAPTLSGGEARRIRLASQLGSNLRGVCYILDEPTIGLHARDNRMLLQTLKQLREKGNTVVIVEHDEDTIRQAEYIVDLGPGGGVNGGCVVAEGSLAQLKRSRNSVTGQYLAKPLQHPIDADRPSRSKPVDMMSIHGASLHNLRSVNASIPLGRLVCVTGVSGSGKSTLIRDILFDNLHQRVGRRRKSRAAWRGCERIEGWEGFARVMEVDQAPIGKTPRSCPATYVGLWDNVRRLFAEAPEARIRGYKASRFSFNVSGGRCPDCEGQGVQRIEMSFLPDVRIPCDTCGGKRYNRETLDVCYKDKSIGDVLAMSIDEAVEFFSAHAKIHRTLRLLQDVGLGYLTLGQQSPTLSGGEAQRIKLVAELARAPVSVSESTSGRSVGSTLYVLDEPTVGLHMADVVRLIRVLHRLVDNGHTVVVIEHNLDVIAEADWVLDLGPEGGDGGGRIVASGPPTRIIRTRRKSHTAEVLKEFLAKRGGAHLSLKETWYCQKFYGKSMKTYKRTSNIQHRTFNIEWGK